MTVFFNVHGHLYFTTWFIMSAFLELVFHLEISTEGEDLGFNMQQLKKTAFRIVLC